MRILHILGFAVLVCLASTPCSSAQDIEASAPKGVSISAYDTGLALVSEVRSITLAKGENKVRVRQMPARLDPFSVAFSPLGGPGFELLDQRFENDLTSVDRVFKRYLGRTVEIVTLAGTQKGALVSAPSTERGTGLEPLVLRIDDGSLKMYRVDDVVSAVLFPQPGGALVPEPTLFWRLNAGQDGPQRFRLSYATEGLAWSASYEAVLTENEVEAFLTGRVALSNGTGTKFDEARIKLVSTEKGSIPSADGSAASPAMRYAQGASEPTFEKVVAGAAALQTYELPAPVSLANGETRYVQLLSVAKLPVSKVYEYDGVKFDRFQRNRRNDWNYGTEYSRAVETYLRFSNSVATGLGMDMPPGRLRLYRQKADGMMELAGEDTLLPTKSGTQVQLLLGPAVGLLGERERTGYSEITPLHEYEESFEIRLENNSGEDVEVRVLEHLYRWNQYEIVKADTDYRNAGAQAIEFQVALKSGGRRSIHYTVRYRW